MTAHDLAILSDHQIRTWFNCGGKADRFARPATIAELRRAVEIDPHLRVLGDGANLLVADEGVRELVVELNAGDFTDMRIDGDIISAGAGVNLPKLIHKAIAAGLTGLENLGGIPASIGGACVMNAGGAYGQFGDYVHAVHAVTRDGRTISLDRGECRFEYRHTRFGPTSPPHPHQDLIITRVDLKLISGDAAAARAKLLEVMDYKKRTQPMAADSAGCTFKNPTLTTTIEGIGAAGQRVSAGMLIDRAGAKGLRIGGAEVSPQHGNFFVTHEGCTASDLLSLMRLVRSRVHDRFGVTLQPEVAIWGASL